MITKSKLRKLANSHNSKVDRKTILYAYKNMCKNVKSRARKGHYYYSFSQDGQVNLLNDKHGSNNRIVFIFFEH